MKMSANRQAKILGNASSSAKELLIADSNQDNV
jgi:hypothetical protein